LRAISSPIRAGPSLKRQSHFPEPALGTAEIYRQVERVPDVVESVVIGQSWQNDVRVVLFVKLRDGVELDEHLVATIKRTIR